MTAPTPTGSALVAEIDRVDELLYGLRAAHHRGAKRWYGVRGGGTRKYFHCYICDVMIDTWSADYPVPRHAALRLDEHRLYHCALAGIATTLDPRCDGMPMVTP